MDPPLGPSERVWTTAQSVVAEVRARRGGPCSRCPHPLCGHEVVMSLMMGFADAPLCLPCLAAGVDLEPGELLSRLLRSVRRKGCLAAGWIEADREGDCARVAPQVDPPVRMPEEDGEDPAPPRSAPPRPRVEVPGTPPADEQYDAGDQSCGDLVLLLRRKLEAMAPGSVLELRATDPSAPYDLPAWCRLTRHALVDQDPPYFKIRRREDLPGPAGGDSP